MELLSGVVDGGAAAVLGSVHAINVCCWCVMSPAPKCRFHGGQAKGLGNVDEISWNQKAEVTSDGKKEVMIPLHGENLVSKSCGRRRINKSQSSLVIVATKQ